jgi:hypothetical protein
MGVCVGDLGRAVGPLRPSGQVQVGGQLYAARSQAGWVEDGAEVRVIGGDAFGLLVGPPGPSPVVARPGERVLSAAERQSRREAAEEAVRRDEARAARRAQLRNFLAAVAVVAGCGAVGWLVAGERGLTVGLVVGGAVVVAVVALGSASQGTPPES